MLLVKITDACGVWNAMYIIYIYICICVCVCATAAFKSKFGLWCWNISSTKMLPGISQLMSGETIMINMSITVFPKVSMALQLSAVSSDLSSQKMAGALLPFENLFWHEPTSNICVPKSWGVSLSLTTKPSPQGGSCGCKLREDYTRTPKTTHQRKAAANQIIVPFLELGMPLQSSVGPWERDLVYDPGITWRSTGSTSLRLRTWRHAARDPQHTEALGFPCRSTTWELWIGLSLGIFDAMGLLALQVPGGKSFTMVWGNPVFWLDKKCTFKGAFKNTSNSSPSSRSGLPWFIGGSLFQHLWILGRAVSSKPIYGLTAVYHLL